MKPLSTWQVLPHLQGIFTDIDDTLTTKGVLTPKTLAAMEDLQRMGLSIIAITGRPIEWARPFADKWPVQAIVAENGACAFVKESSSGICSLQTPNLPIVKIYQQPQSLRKDNFVKMQAVLNTIEQTIQGAKRAQDSLGRECDIAIDHSEFNHLNTEQIEQVCAIMRNAGMHATVSSIHINGWFGSHNKWQGAQWISQTLLQIDLKAHLPKWVYIGDSSNDEVMFQHFPTSLGVANINRFSLQLRHLPTYITPSECGQGFCEMAQHILKAHSRPPIVA